MPKNRVQSHEGEIMPTATTKNSGRGVGERTIRQGLEACEVNDDCFDLYYVRSSVKHRKSISLHFSRVERSLLMSLDVI